MKESKQHYNSISDITCFSFDEIIKTGNYSFLFKDQKKTLSDSECENIWENIYDEFIKEFGISEQYKLYLEKMGLYVQHLDAAYNGGDKSQLTLAEIKLRQAEDMMKASESKQDIYAVVSKAMGFRIDCKIVTVKEFYSYLRLISK